MLQLFPGNTDTNTVIRHAFSPAIRAQYLRLYPKEYQAHRSIRIEVVGYYEGESWPYISRPFRFSLTTVVWYLQVDRFYAGCGRREGLPQFTT